MVALFCAASDYFGRGKPGSDVRTAEYQIARFHNSLDRRRFPMRVILIRLAKRGKEGKQGLAVTQAVLPVHEIRRVAR